jgi:hypothetical protein
VSNWKVILATLVIYAAGLVSGGFAVRLLQPAKFQPPTPGLLREEFVRRMAAEVRLSPEQQQRVLKAVHESQERVKELYSLIGPEMTEEMQFVREAIRAELTPEQEKRYDEFMRKHQRRMSEKGRPEHGRPPGAPSPAGGKAPAPGGGFQRSQPGPAPRGPAPAPGPTSAEQPSPPPR